MQNERESGPLAASEWPTFHEQLQLVIRAEALKNADGWLAKLLSKEVTLSIPRVTAALLAKYDQNLADAFL